MTWNCELIPLPEWFEMVACTRLLCHMELAAGNLGMCHSSASSQQRTNAVGFLVSAFVGNCSATHLRALGSSDISSEYRLLLNTILLLHVVTQAVGSSPSL